MVKNVNTKEWDFRMSYAWHGPHQNHAVLAQGLNDYTRVDSTKFFSSSFHLFRHIMQHTYNEYFFSYKESERITAHHPPTQDFLCFTGRLSL